MNMSEKMKEKAISATNTKVSKNVIKIIDRCDIDELNSSMRLIGEDNKRIYRMSSEVINKDDSVYSSIDLKEESVLKKVLKDTRKIK